MKEKIKVLVKKHGFSLKGFLLLTVFFPPAGLFVAFKHPSWTRLQKTFAVVGFVVISAFLFFFGAALITAIATELYKLGSLVSGKV